MLPCRAASQSVQPLLYQFNVRRYIQRYYTELTKGQYRLLCQHTRGYSRFGSVWCTLLWFHVS